MWIEESFFKYITAIILVLLTTLLISYNIHIFYFLLWFVAAVFLPLLFSTLLYYLLRPLVSFLSRWLPRYLAILAVYALILITIVGCGVIFVPEAIAAMDSFSIDKLDSFKESTSQLIAHIKRYLPNTNVPFFEKIFVDNLSTINKFIYDFFIGLAKAITESAIAIGLTPFILYYFLRDDNLLSRFILRFVPSQLQEEVQKIMHEVDVALAGFVNSQAIIALIAGAFLFTGYLAIGLPYPTSLALFAMIFYVIPFLGTFIALIPALALGMSISLKMALKVIIVVSCAHLLESHLIIPRLMSHNLKIHPLTVILLLLIGGSIFGILGLILITPAYAILKVIVWNVYKIARLRYETTKIQRAAESENK